MRKLLSFCREIAEWLFAFLVVEVCICIIHVLIAKL